VATFNCFYNYDQFRKFLDQQSDTNIEEILNGKDDSFDDARS